MSLVKANGAGEVSTGFYNNVIDQSLRFEDGDSSYLLRTPSSAGNRREWTISCWVKIGNTGLTSNIISVFQSASPNQQVVVRFYQDKLYLYDFGGAYLISTNRVFRDTTNWYHILWRFDSTQSTTSERIKLYINGTQETDLENASYPSLNHDSLWNSTNKHLIGARTDNSTPTPIQRFDGYLAEFNLVDGQALGPESFGETKNDVWIPKSYSGSYGTNGFRLTFGNASNLGEDSAGSNDFSSSGLASTDVVLDSPENNFSVLNRADARYGSFSEGNLRDTYATTGELRRSTHASKTGKWYVEVNCIGSGGYNLGIYPTDGFNKDNDPNYGVHYRGSTGQKVVSNSVSSYGATYGVNDIIGIAVDMDNNTVTFYKNNSSQGSISYTIDEHHAFHNYSASGSSAFFNFGQDSTFGGNETRQNNTDDNGIGDFYYTPPSGFLALCSANLSDTTLSPDQDEQATDYFNTVTYSGNSSNTHQITGVGFQPDWLWIKVKNQTGSHYLADSSRGLGTGDSMRVFMTNGSTVEYTSENDQVRSFDADGFTLDDNTDNTWFVNRSSDTYVAWNWRLNGGTTSSDTNGNRTTTIQTNANSGISIATYNNPSQGAHTFGHGLGSKPEAFIWRARNTIMNWIWWDSFNFTDADRDGQYFNGTSSFTGGSNWLADIDDTIISILDGVVSSGNNIDYWCISFKSVEGFSKIGKYIGNGSTDGTFVYTGFRPAWVLIKQISGTGSWLIHDNKRSPTNPIDEDLFANLNSAESDNGVDKDFLSNGFKHRASHSAVNGSGETYVYLAFAEQPFKFSNSR